MRTNDSDTAKFIMFALGFIIGSMTVVWSGDSDAGSAGDAAKYDKKPAQGLVGNKNSELASYIFMTEKCRMFNGQMTNDRTCYVDLSQVYTCRGLFESHGGECKVRNDSGSGSCDTVIISGGGSGGSRYTEGHEWRSRGGKPHGTIPSPGSLWLMIIGLVSFLWIRSRK